MKVFHNEKRGVKEEQNRNIPHLSFSTKNTPKKITQKIKPYSWNNLTIYFTQSQTAALNKNKHTTSLRKGQTVSDHLVTSWVHYIYIWYWFYTLWPWTHRVYWKECAVLHKNVSQFNLNLYNHRHLYTFLVEKMHLAWSFLWSVRTKPLLCNYFCKHATNRSIRHLQKTICFIA